MGIRPRQILIRCLLLSFVLPLLLVGPGFAQVTTPLVDLKIALWPEYDRPEVLVIFQGRVAEEVPLPAPLSFDLPGTVQTLNAVAYLDEAQGTLLNLPDYEVVDGADGKVLSFASPGRQFQFEYYSNDMLNLDGRDRDLSFSFTASIEVANLTFELQQPTTAQTFTSDPLPSTTRVKQDGLAYALYEVGRVSPGDSRSLQASYSRGTDQLSVNALAGVNVPSSPEQTLIVVGARGLKESLGPILIAVGVLLLTGSLFYWFWSQRAVVVPEPAPRQRSAPPRQAPRKRKKIVSGRSPPPTENQSLAAYCHRCGTRFRDDARFCHACGSERRAE